MEDDPCTPGIKDHPCAEVNRVRSRRSFPTPRSTAQHPRKADPVHQRKPKGSWKEEHCFEPRPFPEAFKDFVPVDLAESRHRARALSQDDAKLVGRVRWTGEKESLRGGEGEGKRATRGGSKIFLEKAAFQISVRPTRCFRAFRNPQF